MMIYPPRASVFYQKAVDEKPVDEKKKNQINPEYSKEELEALYHSFVIENPDELIPYCANIEKNEVVLKPFKEIIRHVLSLGACLPVARLWLRQIPEGVHLCHQNNTLNGLKLNGCFYKNGVFLATDTLKYPTYCVQTFIHELAHLCDAQSIEGLSVFPYQPVNEGKEERLHYDLSLTEQELFQLVFIDEAEKKALSKQLAYESEHFDQNIQYIHMANRLVYKHYDFFKTWQPPESEKGWTKKEIELEKYNRTMFYSAIDSMTREMKHFLKPYTSFLSQLPQKAKSALVSTPAGLTIDFKKIALLDFKKSELDKIAFVASEMGSKLSYQVNALKHLKLFLENRYCQKHQIDFEKLSPKQQKIVQYKALYDINERLNLSGLKPSAYFQDYIQRIEGRYMGYIKAEDLMPKNMRELVYAHKNKNPSFSLLDLDKTYFRLSFLYNNLERNYQKYFLPFYIKKVTDVQQNSLLKAKSAEGRA